MQLLINTNNLPNFQASPVIVNPKLYTYFGPEEPTLQLDCWEEELSPAQLEAYKKADDEHNSIQTKLNAMVKESGGEVVYSGNQYSAYTVSGKYVSMCNVLVCSIPNHFTKIHSDIIC